MIKRSSMHKSDIARSPRLWDSSWCFAACPEHGSRLGFCRCYLKKLVISLILTAWLCNIFNSTDSTSVGYQVFHQSSRSWGQMRQILYKFTKKLPPAILRNHQIVPLLYRSSPIHKLSIQTLFILTLSRETRVEKQGIVNHSQEQKHKMCLAQLSELWTSGWL